MTLLRSLEVVRYYTEIAEVHSELLGEEIMIRILVPRIQSTDSVRNNLKEKGQQRLELLFSMYIVRYL